MAADATREKWTPTQSSTDHVLEYVPTFLGFSVAHQTPENELRCASTGHQIFGRTKDAGYIDRKFRGCIITLFCGLSPPPG